MKTILEILKDNNNQVDFSESLTVKLTPHQPAEKIVGVVTDGLNVFYKTKQGENKFLSETNYPVINSIRQRLLLLKKIKKEIL